MATKKTTKTTARKRAPTAAPSENPTGRSTGSGSTLTTLTTRRAEGRRDELSVTVSGSERAVRRALTIMRFDEESQSLREPLGQEPSDWSPTVARQIALDETQTEGAELDDELAGPRLQMFSPDDRELYRDRCVNEAAQRGHAVSKPSKIPTKENTTVMEVGDALFDNAQP